MFCAKCGSSNPDQAVFCSSCGHSMGPETRPAGQENPTAAALAYGYAGFWSRFAAAFIDVLIVGLISFPALFISEWLMEVLGYSEVIEAMTWEIDLPYLAISAAYFVLMESGEKGATFGKRLVKIRVLDIHGNRIGKGRAFARWAGHALSYITLCIGFLIQPLTAKKQALHDMVAGTVIVKTEKKRGAVATLIIAAIVFFVMAIVGMAVVDTFSAQEGYRKKAKLSKVVSALDPIKTALAMYYQENGYFPLSTKAINLTPAQAGTADAGSDVWTSLGFTDYPSLPAEVSNLSYISYQNTGISHQNTGTPPRATSFAIIVTFKNISETSIDGTWLALSATPGNIVTGPDAITWSATPAVRGDSISIKWWYSCNGPNGTAGVDKLIKKYFVNPDQTPPC